MLSSENLGVNEYLTQSKDSQLSIDNFYLGFNPPAGGPSIFQASQTIAFEKDLKGIIYFR